MFFMKGDIRLRAKDNDLVLELDAYDQYEDVELIADILKKYFKAEITRKLDGPSNRVWFVKIEGSELQVHQVEGYGCFLKAMTEDAKIILKEIEKHWSLYS